MKQNKYFQALDNSFWIIKLSWQKLRIVSIANLIGVINNYGSSLLRAFLVGLMIDKVIAFVNDTSQVNLLTDSLFLFGAFYLITGLASVLSNYGNNLTGFQLGYTIPKVLLNEKLNTLSVSDLESPDIQNKINRYQENQYTFENISRYLFVLIAIALSLLGAIIPLLLIVPINTLVLILASVPAFIINRRVINRLWELDKETTVIARKGGNLIHMLGEPAALKEIKLIKGYRYLKRYFDQYLNEYYGQKTKIYERWSLYDTVNTLLVGSAILWGIYNLVLLAANGQISVGQIAFYLSALTTVSSYIDNFSAYFASYMGSSVRLTEMRELLELPTEDTSAKTTIEHQKTPPLIQLKDVSFAYPGSDDMTIRNLNLEIKPGEKIAIVGENGAGKTTLVKLISNTYATTSGEVLVNGQDLKQITEDSWMENLGVLYQDYNTYEDLSAFENVAIGRAQDDPKYDEIREAAEKADAHDFIMAYQDNYSQILSERYEGGIRPSTGQWQKIAIARFFYRNAPILILDEPTASIDAVSEAQIFERLYEFAADKTVIVISHRFSTVRRADKIYVIDQGQIIEQGTHEELLALDGKYKHAFEKQAEGYK